jgi:periplasmic protein CpxP/Spy
MTDTGTTAHDTGPAPERRRRRWRGAIIGAALFAVGTASGFAVATAHGMPWWMLGAAAHHRFDPERIAARIDHRVDRVLSRVDATAEQRGKVSGITKAAIADLSALGGCHARSEQKSWAWIAKITLK